MEILLLFSNFSTIVICNLYQLKPVQTCNHKSQVLTKDIHIKSLIFSEGLGRIRVDVGYSVLSPASRVLSPSHSPESREGLESG